MAEEVLKKLGEQLRCTICLDTYTEPKILQCFHVYCQQYLVVLMAQDQLRNGLLTCPTCRQVTTIPEREIAGLHPAFHINHLLELQRSALSTRKPVGFCPKHTKEELKLYCETCRDSICLKCAIKGGGHQKHQYRDVNDTKKCKQEITAILEPVKEHAKVMNKVLEQLNKCCGEISDQQETLKCRIRGDFRQLHELLDARETALIGQLDCK